METKDLINRCKGYIRGTDHIIDICDNCTETLKSKQFFTEVLEVLTEKEDRENPQPIPMDKLKTMRNEPIWIMNPETSYLLGCFVIFDYIENKKRKDLNRFSMTDGRRFYCFEYGRRWVAYRYKPNKKTAPGLQSEER